MGIGPLIPLVFGEIAKSGPEVSPLEGANPTGRADVLLSRLAERVIGIQAPGLVESFRQAKPAMDLFLQRTFAGTRFGQPKVARKRRTRKGETR